MDKELPADVLAYVADCEAVAKAADWPDMLRLCRIVRDRQALLDQAIIVADAAATALEICAAENDALRERLAKLETAAEYVLGLLFESSACDEGCDCVDCQCIETLDALGLSE